MFSVSGIGQVRAADRSRMTTEFLARMGATALLLLHLGLAACNGPVDRRPAPTASATSEIGPPPLIRIAAVGDVGEPTTDAQRIADQLARIHREDPLDHVLFLGDLIYPDGDPAEYDQKFGATYGRALADGPPWSAVLGNHDLETNMTEFMTRFHMPARYYSFEIDQVRFFALDTSMGAVDAGQLSWLEGELSKPAGWKVPFMHVPPFSSGMHGSSPQLQEALVPLFERFGIGFALAAHDHNYERTKPIRGTTYVISGGGCCPRRISPSEITASAAGVAHFILLEILAEALLVTAFDASGKPLDEATITHSKVPAALNS